MSTNLQLSAWQVSEYSLTSVGGLGCQQKARAEGPFFVAFLLPNLWITFLLPKSYVGNVGNVVMEKKLTPKRACAVARTVYYHIDNENKVPKV